MQILLQHQIALAALVTLYRAGLETQRPEVKFDINTTNFTVNGKPFDYTTYNFNDVVNLEDIELLQRFKIRLDHNDAFHIVGDRIFSAGALTLNSLDTIAGFAFQNMVCFKDIEDAQGSLALAKKLDESLKHKPTVDQVTIKMFKYHQDAKEPRCAYNGTSAAFDVATVETVKIAPGDDAIVPVGIRFSIPDDQPYYMTVHMRSSYGFKQGIQNHIGIIDSGYSGDFGIKVMNHTKSPVTIMKGDYFAQVLVHKKPQIFFEELNSSQWAKYEETQLRGSNGFGSSGK